MNTLNVNQPNWGDDARLNDFENAFAHDLAVELADKWALEIEKLAAQNLQGNDLDRAKTELVDSFFKERIYPLIKDEFGGSFPQDKINVIANSIFTQAGEIARLKKGRRVKGDELFQHVSTDKGRDKFARLIPASSVNPQVASDLFQGRIWRAMKGFHHKLDRAGILNSVNAYNLEGEHDTASLAEELAGKQSDQQYGVTQKAVLVAAIKELEKLIANTKKSLGEKEKSFNELQEKLRAAKKILKKTDSDIDEFKYTARIQQYQEDQAQISSAQGKAAGVLTVVPSLIFGSKDSSKYAKAYTDQAEAEQQLIELETALKNSLGVDLSLSPVEENENAKTSYNPDTISLAEFQARQDRLLRRVDNVKALLESQENSVEAEKSIIRDRIYGFEMSKLSHESEIKKIDKQAKKWTVRSTPELERLFWNEFGDKVTQIRDRQSRLPLVSRLGKVAYRAKTTAIFREYTELRSQVEKMEELYGVKGLKSILDRELGVFEESTIRTPEAQTVEAELQAIKDELRLKTEGRLGNFSIPGNLSANLPNTNVPATPTPAAQQNVAAGPNSQAQPNVSIPSTAPVAPQNVAATPNAQAQSTVSTPSPAPASPQNIAASPNAQAQPTVSAPSPAPASPQNIAASPNAQAQPTVSVPSAAPVAPQNVVVTSNVQAQPTVSASSPAPMAPQSVATAPNTQARPGISMPSPSTVPAAPQNAQISPNLQVQIDAIVPSLDVRTLTEARELVRTSESLVIGDLNGSLNALRDNLLSLKAIEINQDGSWKWIGGNRNLILLGDILGDRVPEGELCLKAIAQLELQVKAAGGEITRIYGNHEDIWVSTLTDRRIAGQGDEYSNNDGFGNAVIARPGGPNGLTFSWQGLGVLEFVAKYTNFGKNLANGQEIASGEHIDGIRKAIEDMFKKGQFRDFFELNLGSEALSNMRASVEGKATLEEVCKIQLLKLDAGTLFFHNEPSLPILKELDSYNNLDEAVQKINEDFTTGLRYLLLGEGQMSTYFTHLCNLYLHPDKNRGFQYKKSAPEVQQLLASLNGKGLKRIVHGHTTIDIPGVYKAESVEIANVDFGAGKPGSDVNLRSVAYLGRTDGLHIGKDEAEKIEKFDALKRRTDGYLRAIFHNRSTVDYDALSADLMTGLKINSVADLDNVLNQDVRDFLNYCAMDNGGMAELHPSITEIQTMINFHNEWYSRDSRSPLAKQSEISSYGCSSLMEIPVKWREKHGQAISPATTPDQVQGNVAGNVTAALNSADSPASTDADNNGSAGDTIIDSSADNSAGTEVAPTSPLPNEVDKEKDEFHQMEIKALGLFGKVFGADANKTATVIALMESLKYANSPKYPSYIKLICQYEAEIMLLFTGKMGGEKIAVNHKPKPIGTRTLEKSIREVLGKSDGLEKLRNFIGSHSKDQLAEELSKMGSMLKVIQHFNGETN